MLFLNELLSLNMLYHTAESNLEMPFSRKEIDNGKFSLYYKLWEIPDSSTLIDSISCLFYIES